MTTYLRVGAYQIRLPPETPHSSSSAEPVMSPEFVAGWQNLSPGVLASASPRTKITILGSKVAGRATRENAD